MEESFPTLNTEKQLARESTSLQKYPTTLITTQVNTRLHGGNNGSIRPGSGPTYWQRYQMKLQKYKDKDPGVFYFSQFLYGVIDDAYITYSNVKNGRGQAHNLQGEGGLGYKATIGAGLNTTTLAFGEVMNVGLRGMIYGVESLVKTLPGEAFFWSGKTDGVGGATTALDIAKSKGGTTLEGLMESKGIKMPEWDINNPASVKAWEEISVAYASQVSGKVRAVVGQQLRSGNIWETVELPALKANKNVTEIITIDPKTQKETTIFKR